VEGFFLNPLLLGKVPLWGKKCSSCAWFMATGSEVSGSEGHLGVFLGATSCLSIQMLFGQVLARKSAQYQALAFLKA